MPFRLRIAKECYLKSMQLQISEWKKENTVYFIMLWCCTLELERNVKNPTTDFSYFYFTAFGVGGIFIYLMWPFIPHRAVSV